MSEAGACPRALAAPRLGYEPRPPPEFLQLAATEGERHEAWIAEDLKGRGWETSPPATCTACGAKGEHVELAVSVFRFVGHIDRRAYRGQEERVAEFKALGRFRAASLRRALDKGTWAGFYRFAVQASLYHHATGLPVLYCLKDRDTGRLDVYEDLPLLPLEEIVDRLLEMEIAVRKGGLPPCEFHPGDFEHDFCPYSYLHEARVPQPADEHQLAEVAETYHHAYLVVKEAEAEMDTARAVFLDTLKARGVKTLSVGLVKATYIGPGATVSYPKAKLEALVSSEVLAQCREEKPRGEYARMEVK